MLGRSYVHFKLWHRVVVREHTHCTKYLKEWLIAYLKLKVAVQYLLLLKCIMYTITGPQQDWDSYS